MKLGYNLQATGMAVWNPIGETRIVCVDPGRSKVAFTGCLDLQTGEELVTHTTQLDAITRAQPLQPSLGIWANRGACSGIGRLDLKAQPSGVGREPALGNCGVPARLSGPPSASARVDTDPTVDPTHATPKWAGLADRFEAHLQEYPFYSSFLEHEGFDLICPFLN